MITTAFKVHNLNELSPSKQLLTKVMMRVYRFLLKGNLDIGKYDKDTTDKLTQLLTCVDRVSNDRWIDETVIPPIKQFAVDYAKAAVAVTKEHVIRQFSCRGTLYQPSPKGLGPEYDELDDVLLDKYEQNIDLNSRLKEIYDFCIRLMIEEMIESSLHQVSELTNLRNLMVQTRIMIGDGKTSWSIMEPWGVNHDDPVEKFITRVFDALNYIAAAIEKQDIREHIKENGLTEKLLEQYDDVIKTYSLAKAAWENPNTPF